MYTPTDTTKTYTLSRYQFRVFNVSDFDFHEEIDFQPFNGVYCFTTVHYTKIIDNPVLGGKRFEEVHDLLYLGKANDLTHRFCGHQKGDALKQFNPLYMGIYYCSDNEDEVEIERTLLHNFNFQMNKDNNTGEEIEMLPNIINWD